MKEETKAEVIESRESMSLAIVGGNNAESFALTQRKANVFAQSKLVPTTFQNNLPDCIIALEMAVRMGVNPLMVMQNLYIVHGKPSWSSQFLISCFNTSGRFSPMKFTFVGKPGTDQWGCFATSKEKESGEELKGATITMAMAKAEGWSQKAGSKWQTMPEQMLMYRAASFFVRVYAPEIGNGMHTKEEIEDVEYEVISDSPKVSAAQEADQNENSQDFDKKVIESEPVQGQQKKPEEKEIPPELR